MWRHSVVGKSGSPELFPVFSQAEPLRRQRYVQRIFDISVALVLLILTAPFLALAVLAIKLENPSASPFFKQIRYGQRGVPFPIIKLRTMVPGAELLKEKYASLSVDQGPGFKIERDPRVTPVGRVLRKFYMDELPQLINVLRGEMAIVGPRANSFDPKTYEPWQRIRLVVKPGITGPWQVARNKPTSFDDRCRMDIDYLRSKSLKSDIGTIVTTVLMILMRPSGT